jgi:hypothetical protein
VEANIMLSASTVLVANFMNGNNAAYDSRVYLWNSSTAPGDVTVRIFSLPLAGGLAQELTAPLNLATLGARSARNLKVAEDILVPAGITTPYTNDGGNLTLEFTVQAPRVRGAAQVFSDIFAFGTYPLQEMPATSGASPTVLVANFMNGNDAAFNSRIYLWNPYQFRQYHGARLYPSPEQWYGPGADDHTVVFGSPGSRIGPEPQVSRRYPHSVGNPAALYGRRR